MSRKTFRIYTKTFGGKIWTILHRVSPWQHFWQKIEQNCFWDFSRQKIVQHLVQKLSRIFNLSSSLNILSVCKFLVQDAVYIQDKLRNITWQVMKWKYLAKKRFFVAKNLSILFPFLENSFQLTNALNNFTCSNSFILSCVVKTRIACHVNLIKSKVYAT